MTEITVVFNKFAELSGIPVENIFKNESSLRNIKERIDKYGLDAVLRGMETAANDLYMQSPEKFNIPYLFTKGKMEHWIYLSNKRAARKGFKWEIPHRMKHPEYAMHPA